MTVCGGPDDDADDHKRLRRLRMRSRLKPEAHAGSMHPTCHRATIWVIALVGADPRAELGAEVAAGTAAASPRSASADGASGYPAGRPRARRPDRFVTRGEW